MRHIRNATAQMVREKIRPLDYYRKHLTGQIGKQSGNGWHAWRGLCPFHADTKAGSFYIHPASGAFRCFSCGAKGGDIIAFHRLRYGVSFQSACRDLSGAQP